MSIGVILEFCCFAIESVSTDFRMAALAILSFRVDPHSHVLAQSIDIRQGHFSFLSYYMGIVHRVVRMQRRWAHSHEQERRDLM